MADRRGSDFPAASAWSPTATFLQNNPAGLTEKVTPAQVETKLESDGFVKAASPSLGQVAAYTAGGWAPIKLADANIDAAAAIGWGKISKSGAVATDVGALPEIVVTGTVNFNSINSGLPCSVEIDPSSVSNGPTGYAAPTKAHLLQSKGAANYLTQVLTTATAVAFRGMTSPGVWGAWRYAWDDAYLPISVFAQTLLDDANAAAARTTLGALPTANPTATGTLTAPDVIGGLARMQASAVSPSNQAWFGYTGLNSAGAYVGYYPGSDGAVRIAAASGETVSIGTGAAYGQLVISDSGVVSSSLVGTGTRPASVDSTGKFSIVSKADFFHLSTGAGSSTFTDVTDWAEALSDEAHYKCAAFGSVVSATATYTEFRFIIGGVSGAAIRVYSKGDFSVNFDITTIASATFVCAAIVVYGSPITVIQEVPAPSFVTANGIRLQVRSDDDNALLQGRCTRLERLQ